MRRILWERRRRSLRREKGKKARRKEEEKIENFSRRARNIITKLSENKKAMQFVV